jgi:hypothetical protein
MPGLESSPAPPSRPGRTAVAHAIQLPSGKRRGVFPPLPTSRSEPGARLARTASSSRPGPPRRSGAAAALWHGSRPEALSASTPGDDAALTPIGVAHGHTLQGTIAPSHHRTIAPSHHRTIAPSHHRSRAPAHQRTITRRPRGPRRGTGGVSGRPISRRGRKRTTKRQAGEPRRGAGGGKRAHPTSYFHSVTH